MKLVMYILMNSLILLPLNKGSSRASSKIFTSDSLSIETVYNACVKYGIIFPDIVTAQSILETGYYSSRLCTDYNNLFGLYNSNKKTYFKFEHWEESILGYKDMVEYKFDKEKTKENYFIFLEELPYAIDEDYINKIKVLLRRHFPTD